MNENEGMTEEEYEETEEERKEKERLEREVYPPEEMTEEERYDVEKIPIETEEELKEKKELPKEIETPFELKGHALKVWLDSKSGHVFTPKQHKLKRIGHYRHLAFDKWLHDRYVKEQWYAKGIDYRVFDISQEDIDAIVFQLNGYVPLEVYELSNIGQYRDPFPFRKFSSLSDNEYIMRLKKRQQKEDRNRLCLPRYSLILDITWKALDFYYLPENCLKFIANENVRRHKEHLCKFKCKRYVVLSFPENLTEYALWEYAKNGIRIKVLGYQD